MDDKRALMPVVITDVHIPFWSMVTLLVKWAIAAIPAVIILMVIGFAVSAAISALTGGLRV